MTQDENRLFVARSESLVKPVDITAISFLGDFNKYLPKKIQNSIMKKGSQKVPYMGFIVDPYCFFLQFEIKDPAKAQSMLPEGYELAGTSIFKGGEKKPSVIMSVFSVRTSVFTGMRLECYIIARNVKTGLMSWIIADYETNTTSHDPKNGFCGYTCDPAYFAVTPYGELVAEVRSVKGGNAFATRADIKRGDMRAIDEELWIEGNLSIDYGGKLKDPESSPFSLIFDPVLMKEAKEIPLAAVSIPENSCLGEIIDGTRPVCAALFPYSQHFVIRQDLTPHAMKKTEDLYSQVDVFLKGKNFKTMSGDDIKKPLLRSMLISSLINWAVILFLLIMLFR